MSLRIVTAPTQLCVDLDEAKAHLRVTDSAEDDLIESMLWAAQSMAEQATGRALMPQTWEYSDDDFDEEIALTRVPVQSVTSVTYEDRNGATQTLDPSAYVLDNADDFSHAELYPAPYTYWPIALDKPNSVRVRFIAGYTSAITVPHAIKSWIKLQVSAMYENREAEAYSSRAVSTTVKMSFVDGLLDRYRVYP